MRVKLLSVSLMSIAFACETYTFNNAVERDNDNDGVLAGKDCDDDNHDVTFQCETGASCKWTSQCAVGACVDSVCSCLSARLTGPKCDICKNQNLTGPLCDQCVNPNHTGQNCDQCSDPKFTGDNCDQCSDPKFTGDTCDECIKLGFYGPDCDIWKNDNADYGIYWNLDIKTGLTWAEAYSYCDGMNIDGFTSTWRLPTISELRSVIVGCGVTAPDGECNSSVTCTSAICNNAACSGCGNLMGPSDGCYINSNIYQSCGPAWSSTEVSEYTGYVFIMFFETGGVKYTEINSVYYNSVITYCVADFK